MLLDFGELHGNKTKVDKQTKNHAYPVGATIGRPDIST
jgi:hypothetical protein